MTTDTPHVMENPIMGRPFVVLLIDDARFKVEVLQHARSFDEATHTVDGLTEEALTTKSTLIVRDRELVSTLVEQRQRQAARMEQAFQ